MPVATLTEADLNRTLLARQGLLARSDGPIPDALEQMGGLQAQYAPSMYIGLWSRVAAFSRADLTGALERAEVVQGTLQRDTIHLTSRADYWPYLIAVRGALQEWWLRLHREPGRLAAVESAAVTVRQAFAERAGEPLHRRDLDALVGVSDRALVQGLPLWLPMVRVPPSGTWDRRRADLYALAEDWVGPEPAIDELSARAHMARRYLAGFGPARPADLKTWTGWMRVADADAALGELDLVEHRGPDGKPLLDLAGLALAPGDAPAPVRFLPTWDATLLAHARRTRILPEQFRHLVFHVKVPQSVATFSVDGAVAGSWRWERDGVSLQWFAEPTARQRKAVAAEAEGLEALHR